VVETLFRAFGSSMSASSLPENFNDDNEEHAEKNISKVKILKAFVKEWSIFIFFY
jgi:hypothetical protein